MTEALPSKVVQLCAGEQPQLVWTNERGGTTYRAGARFIKWNPKKTLLDLEAERIRLQWAAKYHNVPRVLDWGSNEAAQWLVTEALPGTSAVMEPWLSQPLLAARAIGRGLRLLHQALPVADCPFEWSPEHRTGGRVAPERLGAPPIDALVVCHGDPCSPNTIIGADGSPVGHVRSRPAGNSGPLGGPGCRKHESRLQLWPGMGTGILPRLRHRTRPATH